MRWAISHHALLAEHAGVREAGVVDRGSGSLQPWIALPSHSRLGIVLLHSACLAITWAAAVHDYNLTKLWLGLHGPHGEANPVARAAYETFGAPALALVRGAGLLVFTIVALGLIGKAAERTTNTLQWLGAAISVALVGWWARVLQEMVFEPSFAW